MRHYLRLFLLVALTAVDALRAQQPAFRLFTTQDGLVRNWVTKIHRDSKGYLWFCTVEGISLFDGYHFTNFSTRDGLPSRLVPDMIETRQGEYWFATGAGLARFHANHGNSLPFEVVHVGDSKESNVVNTIYEGHDGTIWCGTVRGLYSFRPQDGESAPHLAPLDVQDPVEVLALAEDSRRNLWVATTQTLLRRRPSGQVDSLDIRINTRFINSMVIDGHDRLWTGSFGMAGVDTKAEPPRVLPPQNIPAKTPGRITVLYLDDHSDLWIGGSTGLVRFRPDTAPLDVLAYTPSDSFPINQVTALEQDSRNNLWAGVGTVGAVRLAAGSFELFTRADGLDSVEVQGFTESLQGTPYVITGQWTLNEFSGGRFVPIPLRVPKPGQTWAAGRVMVQDRDRAWWAATGAGVARYPRAMDVRDLKGKPPERIYSVRDGLPSDTILKMFQDSRGDIWAGTNDGVGHWSRATGRWQAYPTADLVPQSKVAAVVNAFAEDSSGNIWTGLHPSGLVRFRGARCELVTHDVPRGSINSLLSDSQGRLWIGSSQGGVGRMDHPEADEPQIRHYGPQEGLSSDQVYSLAEDNKGRIYVAGGRGVDRLDPKSTMLHHFTASSGLPPGDTGFLFRDREGCIWFGSFYGLSRYRPEQDETMETPAPLLRGLRLDGERFPIAETGEREVKGIVLMPEHNRLDVEFRSLYFEVGAVLRYQYRLEDSERDWSAPTEDQTVRYANLAPGKYRFAVRSVTESGKVSAGHATLAFEVLPVFWKRSWFLAVVALSLASGAISLHRYRLNHVLAMERVRTRLATDLHDDVGAGLAEIAILSEVAKRQEPAGNLRLLDDIAGRARSLRDAMSDIVWAVDPREERLSDLVLRLRHVAFTLLETEERRVEFLAPADDRLAIELTPDLRRHVLLFFKEAVTNVARHANATAVLVETSVDGGRFRMSIRDNGRGFEPHQPSTGRGLKSLQYRARELRGSLQVQSAPSCGTWIELNLPL